MSAVQLPQMSHISRRHCGSLALGARAFGISAVLVMSAADHTAAHAFAALLLVGLAGTAAWATQRNALYIAVIAIAEAMVAAVIIGTQLEDVPYALLYLVIPPFIAGLHVGLKGTALVGLIQIVVVDLLTVPALTLEAFTDRVQFTAPWLLTSVASGVLGAWLRQIVHATPRDHDAYHSARRLLAELRTVARSLSAGLDPVGIAQQMLVDVHEAIDDDAAIVLVRTDGGILVPLTRDESGRLSDAGSDDPVVMECWTTESPAQELVGGRSGRRARVALPLLVGVRMIGVIVAECSPSVSATQLHELRGALSEHSLRLDTALVFDEIRTLATADERRRLAREIHDGIAQEVASIGYSVDEMIAESDNQDRADALRSLRHELTRLVNELRLSIFDLRSEVTQSAGFGAALTDYVRLVGTRSGMTVHLSLNETPQRLRVEVETEILRIAQEAITNARRHSGASNLWVSFASDPPHALLTIADDGHGLGKPRSDSYGLRIMRERAERIGASLDIRNGTEGGTAVSLNLASGTSRSPARGPEVLVPSSRKDPADAYVGSAHR